MNLLLAFAQIYVPPFIKKARLYELFEATADAFQCQAPPYRGLPFNECLKQYALFTKDKAQESIRQENEFEVKPRLYQNAYRLAQKIKKSFRIDNVEDMMKISKVVYRILNIEFAGNCDGEIIIRRCFFSSFYSSDVCQLISSLDEGLMGGLSGGTFRFSQRITEGKECCRARLSFERNSN